MFVNPSSLLFLVTLIVGSLITISSRSWLGCWIGLEINLLSFIPLMVNKASFSSEASLKYFLVQALASSVFLFSIIMTNFYSSEFYFTEKLFNNFIIINSALFIKMGAAPLHFWFPIVIEGLTWVNALILITWQKLAPFLIISYTININNFILIIILSCSLFGSIGGLNQSSIRKIIAYSSINHLGWILAALIISNMIWLLYFRIYSFISVILTLTFHFWNIHHILHIYNLNFDKSINLVLFCNLLSLGGLPPFLGFLPKWLVIQNLIEINFIFLPLIIVFLTLLALFFYIRLAYPAFLVSQSNFKWRFLLKNNLNFFVFFFIFFNLTGLLLRPLMYLFI